MITGASCTGVGLSRDGILVVTFGHSTAKVIPGMLFLVCVVFAVLCIVGGAIEFAIVVTGRDGPTLYPWDTPLEIDCPTTL